MKKICLIIMAVIVIVTIALITNINNSTEILRISAPHTTGVISIKDKDVIQDINNLISHIQYTDKELISDISDYNPNYLCKIRLESNNTISYNIVFFNDSNKDILLIHNADNKLKYGYLSANDKYKLINYLKENNIL